MTEVDLFGVEHEEPATRPRESAQRELTRRQRADIDTGRHPLRGGPLHPQAPANADRLDGPGRPFTCGTCTHRHSELYHTRSYAKCDQGPASHGPGTDVRAWWPACTSYEPRQA